MRQSFFHVFHISTKVSKSIIGEDKALSIKIGKDANADSVDFILVRGSSADVDRAVKEILRIVENAENELIDNSHVSMYCCSIVYYVVTVCSRSSLKSAGTMLVVLLALMA